MDEIIGYIDGFNLIFFVFGYWNCDVDFVVIGSQFDFGCLYFCCDVVFVEIELSDVELVVLESFVLEIVVFVEIGDQIIFMGF